MTDHGLDAILAAIDAPLPRFTLAQRFALWAKQPAHLPPRLVVKALRRCLRRGWLKPVLVRRFPFVEFVWAMSESAKRMGAR